MSRDSSATNQFNKRETGPKGPGATKEKEKDVEYCQVNDAMIAIFASRLASSTVLEGFNRACNIIDQPIILTKYDLMEGISRDFSYCKRGLYREKKYTDSDSSLQQNQLLRDFYPGPYIRNYKHEVFTTVLEKLNLKPSNWDFEYLRQIDLAGQLIGDDGMRKLSSALVNCPVEVLVLTKNEITNEGMKEFAQVWRNIPRLEALYLNENQFSDEGVEDLFHHEHYSLTLRYLNLSRNNIGVRSASIIGSMFSHHSLAKIEDLALGGKVNPKALGNNFIKVLVASLVQPRSKPIRSLDLSQAGISEEGMAAISVLLLFTKSLRKLNLSRNDIQSSKKKYIFHQSLMLNSTLEYLQLKQCGYRYSDMIYYERLCYKNDNHSNNPHHQDDMSTIASNQLHGSSHLSWQDQLDFISNVCNERVQAELARKTHADKYFRDKIAPPPRPRATMPTRGKIAAFGSGVTNVKKLDEFEEEEPSSTLAVKASFSLAERARRSTMKDITPQDLIHRTARFSDHIMSLHVPSYSTWHSIDDHNQDDISIGNESISTINTTKDEILPKTGRSKVTIDTKPVNDLCSPLLTSIEKIKILLESSEMNKESIAKVVIVSLNELTSCLANVCTLLIKFNSVSQVSQELIALRRSSLLKNVVDNVQVLCDDRPSIVNILDCSVLNYYNLVFEMSMEDLLSSVNEIIQLIEHQVGDILKGHIIEAQDNEQEANPEGEGEPGHDHNKGQEQGKERSNEFAPNHFLSTLKQFTLLYPQFNSAVNYIAYKWFMQIGYQDVERDLQAKADALKKANAKKSKKDFKPKPGRRFVLSVTSPNQHQSTDPPLLNKDPKESTKPRGPEQPPPQQQTSVKKISISSTQ